VQPSRGIECEIAGEYQYFCTSLWFNEAASKRDVPAEQWAALCWADTLGNLPNPPVLPRRSLWAIEKPANLPIVIME